LRNIKKYENRGEKASESAHPMICLLFASDDIIPEKQTTKQPVECLVLATTLA